MRAEREGVGEGEGEGRNLGRGQECSLLALFDTKQPDIVVAGEQKQNKK